MKLSKQRLPALVIVLYALAALLTVYSVWALIHTVQYISGAVASGQLTVAGNVFDITSFYMTSVGQYIVFAAIIWALGRLLQKESPRPAVQPETAERSEPRDVAAATGEDNRSDGPPAAAAERDEPQA